MYQMNPTIIVQSGDNLMHIIESEIQTINHVIQNIMDPEINGLTRMDIPLSLNNNENRVEVLESEDSKSKTSSHVEIYSNDSDKNISEIKFNTNKKDAHNYNTILNNLNKLKLPELQDIAIDFKLPIQINQKKKTRNELMNNIKDFILNLKKESS
jgi:hypothetical protein